MKAQPFAKWTADRDELLTKLAANMPMYYGRYYEPFVGGGALMFSEAPKNAVISDIDEQLVNAYNQIKDNSDEVIDCLRKYGGDLSADVDGAELEKKDESLYATVKARYQQKVDDKVLDAECAALWMKLNKDKGSVVSEENIRNVSRFLNENQITVRNLDFEELCQQVRPGDFVYFNAPYAPEGDGEQVGFSRAEHERLVKVFNELDRKGGILMLSNNNVKMMDELYAVFNKIETNGNMKADIAPDMSKRHDIIITNY